jgi:hypothetical protein
MLLLVSGASGVGKSAARIIASRLLDESFECVELSDLGPIPRAPTIEWRQKQVEVAVQRAIGLAEEGRHLLVSCDPIPAGEVLAAPSADRIDVAVCLLDANATAQSARLDSRQDPMEIRHLHHGFAEWMRAHAVNPSHVPEAVMNGSWDQMRWERWVGRDPGPEWAMTVIDTSELGRDEVGQQVAAWCRRAVVGGAPVFHAGWHRPRAD